MPRPPLIAWLATAVALTALAQAPKDDDPLPAVTVHTDLTLNAHLRPDDDPAAPWQFLCRTPGDVAIPDGYELALSRTDPGLLDDDTLVIFNPASKIGDEELAQLAADFADVNLTKLDLFATNVTDAGMAHLTGLSHLQCLRLGNDRITDEGLLQIAKLTGLTELRLGLCTGVTDEGLQQIGKLTAMQVLDLGGTCITDAGMPQIGKLTQLRLLWIVGTGVTDAGLVHLEGLTYLNELGLGGTGWTGVPIGPRKDDLLTGAITDNGLAHLEGLANLGTLWLGGEFITDAGLVHLDGLANLKRLWLAGTNVTADGVAAVSKQLPDCRVRTRPNLPGYHAMVD